MGTRAAAVFAGAAVLVLAGSTAAVAGQKVKYDSAEYWSDFLSNGRVVECTKMEFKGKETDSYTTVDYHPYVVVKGGSEDAKLYTDVAIDSELMAPLNKAGKQADISWVVTCDDVMS